MRALLIGASGYLGARVHRAAVAAGMEVVTAGRRPVAAAGRHVVLDLAGAESDQLRKQIGTDLESYGVAIRQVVVTMVRPPASYMESLEARQLAAIQRAEQEQTHALEQKRQADREQLDRQRVTATRELLDLEAANESLRLQRLEERIKAYPDAARYDLDTTRLGVARALAGNSRTMLHIGEPGDLAAAIFPPEEIAAPVAPPKAAPAPRRRP